MHTVYPVLLFVGFMTAACPGVKAIATDSDTTSADEPSSHGYSLNWDYVYRYKNASSAAVDHYWILTASHVADDGGSGNLTIGGEVYTQQEIVIHPTADLALVRYDKPFPGYYPLHDGVIHNGKKGDQRVWDELVMVGYGYPGSVTPISFSQSGSFGTRRWGTNRGEAVSAINTDVGGTAGFRTTTCIQTTYLLVDTPHEAGGNVFDSGGPLFIERDSEWKLAGINLYRDGVDPYTGNRAAYVPDYVPWIKSVIVDYDTDMDGLPDWWETQYAGGETTMDAAADLDSDDSSNYAEWIADTIPTDGNSCLCISAYTNASEVVFNCSTDRQYRIQYRTNLTDTNETWQTEVDWFVPVSTRTVKAVSSSTESRCYRVQVRL